MKDYPELVGLVILSLALLISLCLNVILCIRQRATFCREADECCCAHTNTGGSLSQDEEYYIHNFNHNEQPENTNNHHEREENPIYGNIRSERRGSDSGEVCYEMMTIQHTRDRLKSLETDLNYASLDLKMAKKRIKKNRHQEGGHTQRRSELQDELPVHLTPPVNAFFEVEVDMESHLPSRDTSTMVSHSSIYLNSQQIAQETEEMERGRGSSEQENGAWEGVKVRDERQNREWKGAQKSEESNGSACAQLLEMEAAQGDALRLQI